MPKFLWCPVFVCAECGLALEYLSGRMEIRHPMSTCKYSGQKFLTPVVELDAAQSQEAAQQQQEAQAAQPSE